MAFTVASDGINYPVPLVFSPTQLAGFIDYASTYSEFRIIKGLCKVHLALPGDSNTSPTLTNQPYTYLRVASRPFLEAEAISAGTDSAGQGGSPSNITDLLSKRRVTGSELRQSRWQRQYYPSDIRNVLSFKFYPYTLEWQGRPVGNYAAGAPEAHRYQYLKWRSARKWMPMSFLGPHDNLSSAGDDVSFIGPYLVRLLSAQPDSQALDEFQPIVTLQLWCQFRGQK